MLQRGMETTVEVDGQKVTFSRQELALLKKFAEWIRKQEGDPFDVAEKYLTRLDHASAVELLKDGKQKRDELKALGPGTEVWERWRNSVEGSAYMVKLLLEKHQPDITEEDAFLIAMALPAEGPESLRAIIARASGKVVAEKKGVAGETLTSLPTGKPSNGG